MQSLKRIIKVSLGIFLLILIVKILPLSLLFIISREETERVTSNDGLIDAVLVMVNGGATTSYVYNIFLVEEGEKIKNKRKGMNFVATKAYDLKMQWISNKELEIIYPENAKIFEYSNFWYDSLSGENIRITLKPIPADDE